MPTKEEMDRYIEDAKAIGTLEEEALPEVRWASNFGSDIRVLQQKWLITIIRKNGEVGQSYDWRIVPTQIYGEDIHVDRQMLPARTIVGQKQLRGSTYAIIHRLVSATQHLSNCIAAIGAAGVTKEAFDKANKELSGTHESLTRVMEELNRW